VRDEGVGWLGYGRNATRCSWAERDGRDLEGVPADFGSAGGEPTKGGVDMAWGTAQTRCPPSIHEKAVGAASTPW
jgi:hypothetical protein